jgi:hypothetical protein
VVLLLHVPPVEPSLKDIVEPEHTVAGPLIDNGDGLTVICLVAEQPAAV